MDVFINVQVDCVTTLH